ncbi:sodium-independent sulfate anion transporter-like [Culicoides brevitarsis]|uniref:sodium-independent sulfate anion transporter-like n=1 Tax=Culicoides brevitarsis TaxID=469753 RepID=UPI00307BAC5A
MNDSYQICGIPRTKAGYEPHLLDENDDFEDSFEIKAIGRSNKNYSPGIKGVKERIFQKKTLFKRIPMLTWLSKYSKEDAIGDFIAGLTVGMMIIPQSMAFAGIAGLDPQFGLYSSFLGPLVYVIFGSCKDIPFGATSPGSIMILQAAGGSWQRSVLLAFLSGCIEFLSGIFGLGFLVDFVSTPVTIGFMNAMGITVLATQIRHIFGIPGKGNTFLAILRSTMENIHKIRVGDTVLGCSCIVILLLLRSLGKIKVGGKNPSTFQNLVNKIFWFLNVGRNALIVIVTLSLSAFLYNRDKFWFKINGDIPKGLPAFKPPPFSIPEIRNETTGEVIQEYESFWDIISYLGAGLVLVPLIGALENISVCRVFSKGQPVDSTQELIAIGLANISNSFVGGYRGNGGLSRASVLHTSGVRTQFANFYSAILVILSLLFLTPYFFYIPKAALAAIIISAVIFMIDYSVVMPVYNTKRKDLFPMLVTFVMCLLLRIDFGILGGIVVNISFILYHAARPKLYMEERVTTIGAKKYFLIIPDRSVIFPSADYVRTIINKKSFFLNSPIVLDFTHVYGTDYTSAKAINLLLRDFKDRNQILYFLNLKPSIAQSLDVQSFYNFECLEHEIERIPTLITIK